MTETSTEARLSLAQFEAFLAKRDFRQAFRTALLMLHAIDERYGRLDRLDLSDVPKDNAEERLQVFVNRFAAGFAALMGSAEFAFGPDDYEWLLLYHRWTDLIFALSPFGGTDRVIPRLPHTEVAGQATFDGTNFLRLLAILSPNSELPLPVEGFWKAHAAAAALALLSYLATRYVFTTRAFDFRERLLEWLPERLDSVKLGVSMLIRMPEIYMHCSYAMTPRKHEIKRHLIAQMRRACLEAGCVEVRAAPGAHTDGRQTVIVVAEHLLVGHSVFRTHSRAIASLREQFHVVGIVYPDPKDTPIAALFDETIPIQEGDFLSRVRALTAEIAAHKPVLIFYVGVGMVAQVIALASLRLAPVQCVSFGHGATTMSPAIDHMIVPEDFVVSPACFSEQVVALPKQALPFARVAFKKPAHAGKPGGPIRIAVPASVMKLNPRLFEALARIVKRAQRPVEVQFFPLAGVGLAHLRLARIVKDTIPGARVFPEVPHATYMERLANCDFFVSPFPYGNMNSVVDAFCLGLPGVCLKGPDLHAHADGALFARIGLPETLVTATVDDYIAAAVRLVDDQPWREQCRGIVAQADLDAAFFHGDETLFCQAIAKLIAEGARG